MTDPLITSDDLAVYLKDPSIDEDRADMMISDAQILCESIVSPLPETAVPVVRRVAARAYVTATSSRAKQIADAGSPFGSMPGGIGGVRLYAEDVADLRRLNGGGGAFSIDLLPTGYVAPASWTSVQSDDWDTPA